MKISVKNWKTFQHYNHRNPPWIKLHKALLDDFAFNSLHDASKWILLRVWMLASEYHNGEINTQLSQIAFRLRTPEHILEKEFAALQRAGFITVNYDASTTLASCEQSATTETETEKSKEKIKPLAEYSADFLTFWSEYPKKKAKGAAWFEWKKIKPPLGKVLEALAWQKKTRQWSEGFVLDPERYIKKRCWEDEPGAESNPPEQIALPSVNEEQLARIKQAREKVNYANI